MPYKKSPMEAHCGSPAKMETKVKVKDTKTGKTTMLTKKDGQYYRAGQRVEIINNGNVRNGLLVSLKKTIVECGMQFSA